MKRKRHRLSILSQPLDRAVLLAYFLGGIVPLLGLIAVARRFAAGELLRPMWASMILSMALLSLASFFLLRRATRQALEQARLDNNRLAELVDSSRALAQRADGDEVLEVGMRSAATLAGASAAYFVAARPSDMSLTVRAAQGAEADPVFQRHSTEIRELAALALPERGQQMSTVVRGEVGGRAASALGVGAAGPFEGSIVLVRAPDASQDPAQDGALTALAGLVTVALRNADLRGKQRNFFAHMTNLLVGALDRHLDFRGEHSRQVARLANQVGRAMGLDEERLHVLHFASLLHDIGMLKIDPDSLEGNRLAIEQHPTIGYEMLKQIELWRDVAPIVHHHHEYWDGNGYPDRLSGSDIPLESRIIAVAEVFDSLTSEQSYRPTVSKEDALEIIRLGAGSQFDPEIAELFLEIWAHQGSLPAVGPLEWPAQSMDTPLSGA